MTAGKEEHLYHIYRGVVVRGYDASGDVWYVKQTNCQYELEKAVQEAKSTPQVVVVKASF